jgi:hypothetical protein
LRQDLLRRLLFHSYLPAEHNYRRTQRSVVRPRSLATPLFRLEQPL